jgi:hypothetical protein
VACAAGVIDIGAVYTRGWILGREDVVTAVTVIAYGRENHTALDKDNSMHASLVLGADIGFDPGMA